MRILLSILLAAISLSAYCVEYNCLIVSEKSGSKVVLKSDGLRFEVTDGNHLTALTEDGENVFDIDNLESMEFATDPSAVNAVMAGDDAIEVYTVAGVFVGTYSGVSEALRTITTPGVYVAKSKSKTAKILIP